MKRAITTILLLAHCAYATAQSPNLPDFGSPADAVLNKSQEAQLGRGVVAQLRNAGAIMEDALVTEYIQTLGARLAGHANDGDQTFDAGGDVGGVAPPPVAIDGQTDRHAEAR